MDETIALNKDAEPSKAVVDLEERKEIARLARRLPRRNAVRQIAFGLLEGRSIGEKIQEPLVKVLKTPLENRGRERAVAAWAVGQIPLTEAEKADIAELLNRIVTNRQLSRADRLLKRGIRSLIRTLLITLVFVAWSLVGYYLSPDGPMHTLADLFLIFSILMFVCGVGFSILMAPFSFGLDAARNNSVRRHAARSLGRLGQPLSIGALAVGVMDDNDHVRDESMRAFRKLVPALTPDQYGQHDRETVPALCKLAFAYYVPQAMCLTALEVLGKIGDGRAVKPAEQIAKSVSSAPLRETAERVLPILRERQQRENDPKRLVRAASAPLEPSNLLLRPVQGSGSHEEHLLLRSVASGMTNESEDG